MIYDPNKSQRLCSLTIDLWKCYNTCLTHCGLLVMTPAIWHHIIWSLLVQVMASCLMAPSHYLNQCWLIINKVPWHNWHSHENGFTKVFKIAISKMSLKITLSKLLPHFPGVNGLTNNLSDWKDCSSHLVSWCSGAVMRLYSVQYIQNFPKWVSNYTHYKVWDDITYLFPNSNGWTVEVWEWISNFIPHFTGHVITYPC